MLLCLHCINKFSIQYVEGAPLACQLTDVLRTAYSAPSFMKVICGKFSITLSCRVTEWKSRAVVHAVAGMSVQMF